MKMTLKNLGRILAVFALAALMFGAGTAAAGPGDPQAGTVQGVGSYTMYSSGSIVTATTTLYGGAQTGEATRFTNFNALDVFVTGDISGTRTATVTMQYSADGTTSTVSTSGTPTVYEDEYQMVLSADGTDFVQMPVAGLYVRPKIELSGAVSGDTNGITLTVTAIARNN